MKNTKIHNFLRKNVYDLIYRQPYIKLKNTGNINYADKLFVSYEALCICHLFSPCDPAISESIKLFASSNSILKYYYLLTSEWHQRINKNGNDEFVIFRKLTKSNGLIKMDSSY